MIGPSFTVIPGMILRLCDWTTANLRELINVSNRFLYPEGDFFKKKICVGGRPGRVRPVKKKKIQRPLHNMVTALSQGPCIFNYKYPISRDSVG